jgi:ATP-dependent DNA helicase PIF1
MMGDTNGGTTDENEDEAGETEGDDPEHSAVEGDSEPPLCEEQQRVVGLALTGRNIFYTGSAGCGRTRVLQAIRAALKAQEKELRVMAPTGKAALATEGTTTWSYAGMRPEHNKLGIVQLKGYAAGNKHIRKRARPTSLSSTRSAWSRTCIWSVSTTPCRPDALTTRHAGRVQVILTGDFCQLPPPKPLKHCAYCGKGFPTGAKTFNCATCGIQYKESDKWAFRSAVWDRCQFQHINLSTIHRQSDSEFVSMLQNFRLEKNKA